MNNDGTVYDNTIFSKYAHINLNATENARIFFFFFFLRFYTFLFQYTQFSYSFYRFDGCWNLQLIYMLMFYVHFFFGANVCEWALFSLAITARLQYNFIDIMKQTCCVIHSVYTWQIHIFHSVLWMASYISETLYLP